MPKFRFWGDLAGGIEVSNMGVEDLSFLQIHQKSGKKMYQFLDVRPLEILVNPRVKVCK